MLKKLLVGLAVILVAVCGFIATRPSHFVVQRTAPLKVPPDIAFALVNDFHRWSEWSPWDKLDPNQKRTFEGAAAGTGAIYGWSGNDKVGEGRMLIEESQANTLIRIKLEFIKPWPSTSVTSFTFTPVAEGVSVNWKMEGENDFMGKAASLFMDMDSMVGQSFDEGLAKLGKAAEVEARKRAEAEAARLAAQGTSPAAGQPASADGQAVGAPTP